MPRGAYNTSGAFCFLSTVHSTLQTYHVNVTALIAPECYSALGPRLGRSKVSTDCRGIGHTECRPVPTLTAPLSEPV